MSTLPGEEIGASRYEAIESQGISESGCADYPVVHVRDYTAANMRVTAQWLNEREAGYPVPKSLEHLMTRPLDANDIDDPRGHEPFTGTFDLGPYV
jgi:hypothetical protein